MIEKLISTISPKKALERAQYKKALEVFSSTKKRRYEGAAKGRRTDGIIANSTDSNSEIFSGIVALRNRSRDLCRNNAYAVNAKNAVVSEVIGDGISGQVAAPKSKETDAINAAFKQWASSPSSIDANGIFNFYGLQALVKGSEFESGFVFVKRVALKVGEYSVVPLKLQILESDFLDIDKNETLSGGSKIIQGIEIDKTGKRLAYWLFNAHPGSEGSLKSIRIPASEIIQVYIPTRPGQLLAVPHLSPVMLALYNLEEYQDAQLVKQKIAACFTGFVHDIDAGNAGDGAAPSISERVEPGIIEELPPGKTIEFATPPGAPDYEPSVRVNLRKIAAGTGITYEALTNDYSQVNFSSARMAAIRFNKNVENWRWNYFIPQFCDGVWQWFIEAAILQGITKNKYPAVWTPPKRTLLDPKQDNEADIAAIRGGLASWQEVIISRGKDPDEEIRQRVEDQERFDKYNIIVDSDPRRVMKAGILQTPTAKELEGE